MSVLKMEMKILKQWIGETHEDRVSLGLGYLGVLIFANIGMWSI